MEWKKKKEYRWKYQNRYLTPRHGGRRGGGEGGVKREMEGNWTGLAFEERWLPMLPPSFRYLMDLEREKRAASSICRAILKIETATEEVAISKKRGGGGGGGRRIFLRLFAKLKYSSKWRNIYMYICIYFWSLCTATNAGDLLNIKLGLWKFEG